MKARQAGTLLIGSFLVVAAVVNSEGQVGHATHDGTGEHIDQISIDAGPSGVAQGVTANGTPAVGDRDADGIADAEGYDTPDPGDSPGVCGNGLDDDISDSDADTVPDLADGAIDDGCVVNLSPLETCIEITDNDTLDADEDTLVAGTQDRASIDVTVGAQPGPGGGIPASRGMTAWQFDVNWDVDVLDVDLFNFNFLVLAQGGTAPFSPITTIPDQISPATAAVSDGGPPDEGPGVLARLTIEGNAPGIANLTLAGIAFQDSNNLPIPVDVINGAQVAISKDSNGDTDLLDPGESFQCPAASDLEVVSATTVSDASGTAGAPFSVDVSADVRNNGPDDTVDADVAITVNMPSDCGTNSPNPQILPALDLTEGALPTAIGPASFSVTCTSPSFHDFTGTATISSQSVLDSNLANNTATSPASTTAVSATADIGVGTVTVTGPAAPVIYAAFNLDVNVALTNAGPDPSGADMSVDLGLPADCTTTTDDPQTVPSGAVPLSGATATATFSVTCTDSSNHDFTAAVSLTAPLHATDPNPANATGDGQGTVGVNAPVDLKVNSVTVTAADSGADIAFDVFADVDIHNNGPTSDVDADVFTELFLPADCTSDVAVEDNPVSEVVTAMPVSVTSTLSYTWSVTCAQPSAHTFSVDSDVVVGANEVHVFDTNTDNDFNTGDATAGVTASADLKVASVTVTAPATVNPNTAFNVSVDASLHNNGPFGPATTDVTTTLTVPGGCTAIPTGTQTTQNLPLAVSTLTAMPKKMFSVTCTTSGDKVFGADVTAAVDQLHVSDPTAGNATNSAQATVIVTGDDDGDGVLDHLDNCPTTPNPLQQNLDGDSQGDACDPDDDNDTVPDGTDICPATPNPDQRDTDSDGLGDACDPNIDGDGLPNNQDPCPAAAEDYDGFQDPDGCPEHDNDLDGMCDPWASPELPVCAGADGCPNVPETYDDYRDDDGCPDADNDNDGYPDGIDDCPGTDFTAGPDRIADSGDEPLDAGGAPVRTREDYDFVLDTDGCYDAPGADYDGDGWTDDAEALHIGTDAANPCGIYGWPADLAEDDNRLTMADINSFLFPLRGDGSFNKFAHPVPDPSDPNIVRWDLDLNGEIGIGDINALNPAVIASTARPPMFNGQPAFFTNGGVCPYDP